MVERWEVLSKFHLGWPALTAGLLATILRWLMVIVFLAGVYWLFGVLRNRGGRDPERPARSTG